MKMKKSILLAPDRATKDFPNGKGVSAIIPSCVNTDASTEESAAEKEIEEPEQPELELIKEEYKPFGLIKEIYTEIKNKIKRN